MNKQVLRAVALALSLACGQAFAQQVTVDAMLNRAPGDVFNVNVLVSDVADLAGFQFDLGFDSSVLQALSVTSGDLFGLDTFEIANSIGLGTLTFSETSLAASIDATLSSILATIQFSVLAEGVSALSLGNVVLSDTFGDEIFGVVTQDGQVTSRMPTTVQVVEPSTLLLMMAGLCAMLLLGRRRRSNLV